MAQLPINLTAVVLTIEDEEGEVWTTSGYLGHLHSPNGLVCSWSTIKEFSPRVTEVKIVNVSNG